MAGARQRVSLSRSSAAIAALAGVCVRPWGHSPAGLFIIVTVWRDSEFNPAIGVIGVKAGGMFAHSAVAGQLHEPPLAASIAGGRGKLDRSRERWRSLTVDWRDSCRIRARTRCGIDDAVAVLLDFEHGELAFR